MNAIGVKKCAGVTPKHISTWQIGHSIELMDITFLLIKIYSQKLHLHQNMNSGHS